MTILLFSSRAFPQPPISGAVNQSKTPAEIRTARKEQSQADILADINSLPRKDQVRYYADLGETLWQKDRKEGLLWIAKAVEIALDPATEYKNQSEKVDVLRRFHYYNRVAEKDEVLEKKLSAAVAEILLAEAKTTRADEYSEKFLSFAQSLLKKDVKSAFEFAMLSLNGKKPAFNDGAFEFFSNLNGADELLANRYFARMLEIVKKSDDKRYLPYLIDRLFSTPNYGNQRLPISDAQKKEVYEILIQHVQLELVELLQKRARDCYLTRAYAKQLLNDFRTILPEGAVVIEQALKVCQAADIEDWRKPEPKGQLKTAQDYLDAAKSTTDESLRRHFTYIAALNARDDKNYRLAIEILDSMDEASKTYFKTGWEATRFQVSVELARELFLKQDFTEGRKIIENSPSKFRPYIILEVLNGSAVTAQKNNQLSGLINQAKAEFSKMDFPLPDKSNTLAYPVNPAKYLRLVVLYSRYGTKNEALEAFDEYVSMLNQLSGKYTTKTEDGEAFSYFFYATLPEKFFEEFFERLYQNTFKIESVKMRLEIRLCMFDDLINFQKYSTRSGLIKVSRQTLFDVPLVNK